MAPSNNTAREAREARDRLRRYKARQTVHNHQISRRRKDNLLAVIGVLLVAALATGLQVLYFSAGPGMPPETTATALPTPTATTPQGENVGDVPSPELAEDRTWNGVLALGDDVELGIELDGRAAPQAVASFVKLVQDGYFESKTCHRLVDTPSAGLLQCGSIDGVGGGDENYSFGPIENAAADGVYPAGTIAMARIGNDAYSQGYQFFIVFSDATLPGDAAGGYTIFGTVTSGLDALVSNIVDEGIDPSSANPEDGPPARQTAITRVTIE